jgi:hypothetical protein
MRTYWRVTLVVGPLLIILAFLAALPRLHRLVYSEALPPSAVERTMERMRPTFDAHGPQQTTQQSSDIGYALIPVDRQIDDLGVPERIRTEADALAYVEILVKRWGPSPKELPDLAEFEQRLARAEYAAVRNPEKRIPESQVAKVFNQLMDEWQMPRWTRISVSELHVFRWHYATAIYPRSVLRLPDESIAPNCRPTEALLLLHFLTTEGSVPPAMRKIARDSTFPWTFLKYLEPSSWRNPPENPPESGLGPKYMEFSNCRDKYFASHPAVTFENLVNHSFAQLGIS